MTRVTFPSRLSFATAAAAAIVVLQAACGKSDGSDSAALPSADAVSQAATMQRGLDLLYRTGDPVAAADSFRAVLKANSTHYGARFQLAKALDLSGRPVEARQLWTQVLEAAESINDTATSGTARARLAQPDTVSQAGMVAQGLHLFYTKGDAAGAAEQFRKVLARNPTHYGATFQIAKALDLAGKPDEARTYWQKILEMALPIKDQPTIDVASARLQRK